MVFAGTVRGAGCQARRLLLPSRRLRAKHSLRAVTGYQWFAARARALAPLCTLQFIPAFQASSALEFPAGCIRSLLPGIGSSHPPSGIAIALSRLIRNGRRNFPSGFRAPCLRILSAPTPWCRRLRKSRISSGRQARSPSTWNPTSLRRLPPRTRFHLPLAGSLSMRRIGPFPPRQVRHWTQRRRECFCGDAVHHAKARPASRPRSRCARCLHRRARLEKRPKAAGARICVAICKRTRRRR